MFGDPLLTYPASYGSIMGLALERRRPNDSRASSSRPTLLDRFRLQEYVDEDADGVAKGRRRRVDKGKTPAFRREAASVVDILHPVPGR
jgi:hypothetical protein